MTKKTKTIISLVTDVILAIVILAYFILYIFNLVTISKFFTCILFLSVLIICTEWVLNDIIKLCDIKLEKIRNEVKALEDNVKK